MIRRRLRRRRRWPGAVGWFAGLAAAGWILLRIGGLTSERLKEADSLRLARVEVVPAEAGLTPDAVLAAIGADFGAPMLSIDPASSARLLLKRFPFLRSARVKRRLPDTLQIVLERRLPVARRPDGNLLDEEGAVFPGRGAVPLLSSPPEGQHEGLRLLAGLRRDAPALYAAAAELHRLDDGWRLEMTGGPQVRLPSQADRALKRLRFLPLILADLEQKKRRPREIRLDDYPSPDRILVKLEK